MKLSNNRIGLFSIMLLVSLTVFDVQAQKISTSPTRLNFKVSPGATARAKVHVSNNSDKKQAFQVDFGDFDATRAGKSKFLSKGEMERSCADWLTASPVFFELEPGSAQEIDLVIDVPTDSTALEARWAVTYIRLVEARQEGRDENESDDGVGELAIGLAQAYRFGVYVFQTPPNATESKGEVTKFDFEENLLKIEFQNLGETFLKCNSYAELTSLTTGETIRLEAKSFTVLPASTRDVAFLLPNNFPPGKYAVLGVLDYGNRDEIAAAEIEIEVPKRSN
jgi:P pilus assembly chaperone PapD